MIAPVLASLAPLALPTALLSGALYAVVLLRVRPALPTRTAVWTVGSLGMLWYVPVLAQRWADGSPPYVGIGNALMGWVFLGAMTLTMALAHRRGGR